MYPAIKHGDKSEFVCKEKKHASTVNVNNAGAMRVRVGGRDISLGFQDNPRIMEQGITNFRILERADGLRCIMWGIWQWIV